VPLHTVIVCHLLCLLHAAAIFVAEVVFFCVYISNPGFRADPWHSKIVMDLFFLGPFLLTVSLMSVSASVLTAKLSCL
jgi:hypothetical protein